jgi:hypothetical protein
MTVISDTSMSDVQQSRLRKAGVNLITVEGRGEDASSGMGGA